MATLLDLVSRRIRAIPWEEGDNIPWDEPGFSRRMLQEHLSQDHDLASRRFGLIDEHVAWIDRELLGERPAQVLDLACGPGLYLHRLAELGHHCTGVDFSPASVAYARAQAAGRRLDIRYREEDLRSADLGTGFGLVMLLYGQLNVFRRAEAASILRRAAAALEPGGMCLVEPQTLAHVRDGGHAAATWSTHASGLFSAAPHVLLTESSWDETSATSTQRFHVVDANTGQVVTHAMSNEAYTDADLVAMFTAAGFTAVELLPGLGGEAVTPGLVVVLARR